MKFLVLIIFFAFAVVIAAVIISHVFNENKPVSRRKNVRNFKVRFDAAKEKYYIVNQLETHDEPVTNSLGFRVMYKDKPKAEFVADKYNS